MNIRTTFLGIAMVSLVVCLQGGTTGIDAEKPFVNKPWQTLTEEEKEQNKAYVARVTGKNQETIDPLISLLTDPQTCFLPREALKRLSVDAVNVLRKLVKDDSRPLVVRSEALSVLVELGDRGAVELLEKDPLIRKTITAYEQLHRPELHTFQTQYVNLKLYGLSRREKANVLAQLLEEENCIYVAKRELALLGKDATDFAVQVFNNKEALYFSRLQALNVIKEIEDPKAAPFVMRVLQDHDEKDQLRELAAHTLGVIGNTSYVDTMQQVSEEWRPGKETGYDVRAAVEKAVRALMKKD